MVDIFRPPTRSQLARIARDENGRVDERLVRAFEQLWLTAGQDFPGLQDQVDALEIATAANTARIKTNEVLLWLSM